MKKHSDIAQSQTIVKILKQKGIRRAVISSGSRCAPLTIEFSRSGIECFSIVDERSAAFFALGLAKESKSPIALVCTSGTAVLNYYPAVAEAFYSRVPLIVISADRPQNMIDQGAGQTIRQNGVLSQHCEYSTCLEEGSQQEIIDSNALKVSIAADTAIHRCAPVHINVPFSEPLYGTTDLEFDIPTSNTISTDCEYFDIEKFEQLWRSSKKKMMLFGCFAPDSNFNTKLSQFIGQNDTIVLCESTSNLHHEQFINKIDQAIIPLIHSELQELSPDLLITLGTEIVSKKIKAFLSQHKPKHHIHISPFTAPDTFGALTEHIKLPAKDFLDQISHLPSNNNDYKNLWLQIKALRAAKHKSFKAVFSDFIVWRSISNYIPENQHLEIANSAAIRYSQLFDFKNTISCNRGTSGIDGSTSTAIGISAAANRPVTFVTGDLSFFYDSNALWNNYIPSSMRIILINNSGGGIFKILPGSSTIEEHEPFFHASHSLTATHLAAMHRIDYSKAENEDQLHKELRHLWEVSDRPKILEIFTSSHLSSDVLKEYWRFL